MKDELMDYIIASFLFVSITLVAVAIHISHHRVYNQVLSQTQNQLANERHENSVLRNRLTKLEIVEQVKISEINSCQEQVKSQNLELAKDDILLTAIQKLLTQYRLCGD